MVLLFQKGINGILHDIEGSRNLLAIIVLTFILILYKFYQVAFNKSTTTLSNQDDKVINNDIAINCKQLIENCNKYLSNGDMYLTLKHILLYYESNQKEKESNSSIYNNTLLLLNRLNILKYNKDNNLMEYKDISVEESKIANSTLSLLLDIKLICTK